MKTTTLLALVLACPPIALACSGDSTAQPDGGGGDAGGIEGGPADGGPDAPVVCNPPKTQPAATPVDKLDLLFMIDNSGSMGDKQQLVARSVPDLLSRLVNPNCVCDGGAVAGPSQNGTCAQGGLEFQPVHDIHVGIVTSSLGGRGGDLCDPSGNPRDDDQGHLVNRTAVADASPSGFLAWLPPIQANQGRPTPPVKPLGDAKALMADLGEMVANVGDDGCGLQAQLESVYRFLVQPDPYASIVKNGTRASLSGVDAVVLQQRRDFLRPDSTVAIVLVSSRSERTPDPVAIGGQAWAFANSVFPGSPNSAAPKGSIECQSNPYDANCTSCAFLQSDPNFTTRCPGGAYLDPSDDNLDVRFFHPKQRFGLDTQLPVSRYVRGFSAPKVPDRAHEHDNVGKYVGDSNATCVNPLFAASLPTDPNGDLCNLAQGPRTPQQVYFVVVAGVPHQLLQGDTPSAGEWTRLLGNDPLSYDFSGADAHMLESEAPRQGLPGPTSSDTADPMNGREWDTQKADLEFACVFDLAGPLDCTDPKLAPACDCAQGSSLQKAPLCDPNTPTSQIRGKAYPAVRELAVARALGPQAVVASICAAHATEQSPGDPLFGFRPAMQGLVDKLQGH